MSEKTCEIFGWKIREVTGELEVRHCHGAVAILKAGELVASGRWNGREAWYAYRPAILHDTEKRLAAFLSRHCKQIWEEKLGTVQVTMGFE
jgi:hypothetical protein